MGIINKICKAIIPLVFVGLIVIGGLSIVKPVDANPPDFSFYIIPVDESNTVILDCTATIYDADYVEIPVEFESVPNGTIEIDTTQISWHNDGIEVEIEITDPNDVDAGRILHKSAG